MQYLGGKTRIAKEILPIILADRKEGQYFVEPFCGGCNVTANVSGNRIANDYNEYLIAMFRGAGIWGEIPRANKPRTV